MHEFLHAGTKLCFENGNVQIVSDLAAEGGALQFNFVQKVVMTVATTLKSRMTA